MSPLVIFGIVGIVGLSVSVLIDRFLVPWQARRGLQKLLNSGAKYDPRALEDPKYGRVVGDAEYLRVKRGKGNCAELRWSEVEQVHAYKRDLFTTDLICLGFKKSGKEEYYEIHEEMAGYHDLLEVLPSCLAGFTLEWFPSVAFPAFKTNHRVIWKRVTQAAMPPNAGL